MKETIITIVAVHIALILTVGVWIEYKGYRIQADYMQMDCSIPMEPQAPVQSDS